MGSAAKQRGKEEWLLFYHYIHLRATEQRFLNKKQSLRGGPENTEMNRVIKNVPTAQGKKSIQTLH